MAALARRAAFRLFAQTRNFILHLEIQSPWLTMGLASTGLGAFYVHQSDSDPQHATIIPDELNVVPAVKKGVEGNEGGQIDPEVMRIGPGSIVVKLVCHTEQSFLMFIEDFKEGKIKTRLETEFGNIGRKEPLTVTIPNWDDEVQKNLNAIRMEKIKDAVCLIECMDQEEQEVEFTGTGFHYGNGWVMTAAHNFQDDENDDNTSHSYLSEGKFRVLFHVGGKEYVFPQRKRTAFVHHLNPGVCADEKNKDIAMVKLGIQYDQSVEDWEEEEAKTLAEMKPFAFSQTDPPVPNVGDDVYAIYNGDDGSKVEKMIKIKSISEGETNKVPMLHLWKEPGVLPEGASGCPVMLGKVTPHKTYHLVGLYFSGNSDKKDGEAQALRWKKGIADYVQQGVEAIGAFGPCLRNTALAADNASNPALQKSLEEQAEEYKKSLNSISEKGEFTIYLKKGEDLLKIR